MKVRIQSKEGSKVININRRKAIREKCFNCSGYLWKEVDTCNFDDCQLFNFRSGKGKQNAKNRNKAIHDYCNWCMCGQISEISKCPSKDCPLYAYRKWGTDTSVDLASL